MANLIAKVTLSAVAVLVVLSGCGRNVKNAKLNIGPDSKSLAVTTDFTAAAIEAAGGMKPWLHTKEIEINCVASYYQQDGSSYLTEQQYNVYPWSWAIKANGHEPAGDYIWQLSAEKLKVLEGGDTFDRVTSVVGAYDLLQVVLGSVATPVMLLDNRVEFSIMTPLIKVDGKSYSVIRRVVRPDVSTDVDLPELVLYQNNGTSMMDRLWMVNSSGKGFLSAHCYDYRQLDKDGIIIPGRIEIYQTDEMGQDQRRLIKIDLMKVK